MTRLCAVLWFLVSLPACGDIVGYPIRHRPTSPGEAPTLVYPGSVPAPTTRPVADGSVPGSDLGAPTDPTTHSGCRWPSGADLTSFCSGPAPRAVTDNKILALHGVRATGPVPRFHFILVDGPRQLLAEISATDPEPGTFDLSAENPGWAVRVYSVLCDPDLSCTTPNDWLSVAKGDQVAGWVALDLSGNAALCLGVVRGANHPLPSPLPCATLLYSPLIPVQ